ncbi:hypothetical protein N7539_004619 [Penicillium diatomitis]|uniref:Rhodopsin domain-containing protein n=1 Tax=Penicillium diatomitis TaxID=2819901 RepID=A0A9W9XE52_9EURO|nr:uncharacterized protein N7539_004619 [Penicillium diatomitis]KAJ5489729.1 hypothetical protein N7539_004619 [Penicillium diatomitis]
MPSLEEKYPAYGGRGPGDLHLGITLAIIATIFMSLRVYVRLFINKFGTTALILSLIAWLLTAITQTFGVLAVLHGLGNHVTSIAQVGELGNFLFYTWMTVFFFNLAIPTGKVAVAAFLIEMNGQGNPKIRKSLIAVAATNIAVNIPQALLVWVQCSPTNALWDPLQQDKCDYRKNVYYNYFVGSVAALSDLYLAVVPIHMLLPVKIDRKLKWGLSFLMGCGVFAGVAAIVRTWAAKFILSEDSSYGVGILFCWGEVEEWLVLITMSIPPVWPVFRPFTTRFVKSTATGSRRRGYTYNLKTPYSTTAAGDQSPGLPPPLVTTRISISSVKDLELHDTAVEPSEASSQISDERLPHELSHGTRMSRSWVELSRVKRSSS